MKNTIVLIGAGSVMFGLGTLGDIFKSKILEGSSIVLHDINPLALSKVENIAQQFVRDNKLPYTLSATTSRQDALQDATFCIISIEVGDRYALWEQDWKIPLQYGIRQIFGENGGPGGLFHSLRIIPPILEICDDINTICPDAYVFNFSNPMSRICLTVKRKYPDLKLIGLCHEVASLPMHLPRILETPFSNLVVKAGGLNHFSILLEVKYKDTGKDAYPDVRERSPAYFENMPERGLFREILNRFGYLPITTDSHFGEYIQWAHKVVDHKGILDFYSMYKAWCLNQVPQSRIEGTLEEEYWRVVPIMEGILADSHHKELAVNISNDGLIDNLPQDLVVEVPAIVDKDGVHGIKLGALPKGFAGLLYNQVAVHDLTAEAVLTGSREIALQALLVDPVVDSVKAAEETLDTILKLQSRYLGYIK
ncbi:MAG: alpha-glucosidase [Chloroflexota bacterium]|nr:alpha-glucosidase [Chloroflexota bacterium]